jgi:beta-glucanase (GH16 family)
MAPPGAQALPGYRLTYVNDFNNPGLPPGWNLFTGDPGGISSPNFSAKHVIVTQGLLQLQTYRDPADDNLWTTGGLCQCQRPVTYGAFFVRSRLTAGGSNSAELLWPENNTWPPEIDFNENSGHVDLTTATTHWGTVNHNENAVLYINMTQWHTWGVIWTPTKILYVVDGRTWREFAVPSKVPHIPMTLDFEQRAQCPSVNQCPTQPSAMQIDWVAEYQPEGRA